MDGIYRARNINIDLNNDILMKEQCNLLLNEYNYISQNEQSYNLFPCSYNNTLFINQVKNCDNFQGFIYNHSIGGGTNEYLECKNTIFTTWYVQLLLMELSS